MKIIFSGTPYFGKQLASKFQNHDKKNSYIYLDIKQNLLKRLYMYYHILTADILFITYVDAYYMKSVDFALKLKKNIIFSWIGSDVMNAIPRIKQNLFNQRYLNDIYHTTNSTWLKQELHEVNIDATFLTIYMFEEKKRMIVLPKEFSVLTYVAKDKEKFYGIDTIIKLAKEFPYVQFRIAGIDSYDNLPSNIVLLGWVNMDEEYPKATVYIRYPQHDGEAHSVLEALSYGKIVFYNKNYPYTHYTPNYHSLKTAMNDTLNQFNRHELILNYNGVNYIKENYNFTKTYNEYISLFHKIAREN